MARGIPVAQGVGIVILLTVALLLAAGRDAGPATADSNRPPGGSPDDVALAANDPDEYAWRLFFYINRPALPGAAGLADPARTIRQYDPDQPVVWETWALVSGVGERLAPAPSLPTCAILLVNPGTPLSTPAVFAKREGGFSPARPLARAWTDSRSFVAALSERGNDLTQAAIALLLGSRTWALPIECSSLSSNRFPRFSPGGDLFVCPCGF